MVENGTTVLDLRKLCTRIVRIRATAIVILSRPVKVTRVNRAAGAGHGKCCVLLSFRSNVAKGPKCAYHGGSWPPLPDVAITTQASDVTNSSLGESSSDTAKATLLAPAQGGCAVDRKLQ